MIRLYLVFFKMLEDLTVSEGLRVSVWLEENDSYLMPCEFKDVIKDDIFYNVKIEALDPESFISPSHIEKRFLFGHPGKMIGYGILKKVESC